MTPVERLKAEKDRILSDTGVYVTPCRMVSLMKAAGRITDILVKADVAVCYEECLIILDIVASTIKSIMKEKKNYDA